MKSGKAILFIHGILGGPDFFDFLRESVPADRKIYTVTLKGHGATPRDFSNASMVAWKRQISELMTELNERYDDIVIAAHSMGTLFAIREAVADKASGLFLLNPPLKIRLTRKFFSTPAKVLLRKTDDPITAAAKAAYSISDSKNPLDYVGWIPRYAELFAEIRRTRPLVKNIQVNTQVFLSGRDEMVSPAAGKFFELSPNAAVIYMPNSGHYFYTGSDRSMLRSQLNQMLQ